jgi:hypothetical protein
MSNGGRIAPQLAKLSCDAAPSKVEHDIAVKSTVSQLKLLVVGSFLLFVEASFLRGSSLSSWKLHFFVEVPFLRGSSLSSWKLPFFVEAPFLRGSSLLFAGSFLLFVGIYFFSFLRS